RRRRAAHVQRHRTDGIALGRNPVNLGNEELAIGAIVHHGAVQDAAEGAEYRVREHRRRPFDGVDPEEPWGGHRTLDAPPVFERDGIEEGGDDRRRWRGNLEGVIDSRHAVRTGPKRVIRALERRPSLTWLGRRPYTID